MATQVPEIEIVYLDPLSDAEAEEFEGELAQLLVDAWFANQENTTCVIQERGLSCAGGSA